MSPSAVPACPLASISGLFSLNNRIELSPRLCYIFLTVAEVLALIAVGMSPFDAVCNSFSTMAASGFSPHPQSGMGYQNSHATWIITFFMFLAGSSFALQYRSVMCRRPMLLLKNEEFRGYLLIILVTSAGSS